MKNDLTIAICIIVLSISAFSLFLDAKVVLGGNEGSHFWTVRNLVEYSSFEVNPEMKYAANLKDGKLWVDASKYQGKEYSNKPPGFPLLLYPFYKLYYSFSKDIEQGYLFTRTVNMVFASLAVGLVFLLAKSFFTDTGTAALAAVIAGFGTNAVVYSNILTSHAASLLFYVLLLFSAFSYIRSEYSSREYIFLSGFFAAYLVLTDYSNIFAVALISCYLFFKAVKQRHVIYFLIPYVLVGACFCSYNYAVFGKLFTTAYHYYSPPAHVEWAGAVDAFRNNFFRGFFGLTFGPARGVFIFSPVLIFAAFGAYKKIKDKDIYSILAVVSFLSMLVGMSFYKYWHGGHSMGARHILLVVPVLAIFAALAYDCLKARALKAVFICLLIFSVGVNVLASSMQKEQDIVLLTWKEEPRDVHSSLYTELIPAFFR